MFDLLDIIVLLAGAMLTAIPFYSLIVSRRFRLRLIRGFMQDLAMITTMSEMGKASGDSRFNDKIAGIVRKNIPRFLGEMMTDNPLLGKAIEWFANETEIGDYLDDPRTLGAIMQFMNQQGGQLDLSGLLKGELTGQQKQDIDGGFRIG